MKINNNTIDPFGIPEGNVLTAQSEGTLVWTDNKQQASGEFVSIGGEACVNNCATGSKSHTIARIEEKNKKLLEEIQENAKAVELLVKCPLDKGSIAYHKIYGPCIVQRVNIQTDYGLEQHPTVVTAQIAHKDGTIEVDIQDLVVKTLTSEAIYGE